MYTASMHQRVSRATATHAVHGSDVCIDTCIRDHDKVWTMLKTCDILRMMQLPQCLDFP